MLKIGKVYSYGKKFYLIADKFTRKSRVTYIGQQVFQSGSLGQKHKLKYTRGAFKLQPKIQVEIRISMPRENRDLAQYLSVVDSAIGMLELLEAVNWRSKGLKRKIAEAAWASCYYYNHEEGRYYNLRDFAKQLGFTRPSRLYPWVADYMDNLFTEEKYLKAIPDAADKTIVSQVKSYSQRWNCYFGFSKRLDSLLEKDLKAYTAEVSIRSLQAYV